MNIRITTTTWLVLQVLYQNPDEQVWGFRICEMTGLLGGTVYPILLRLQERGWVRSEWESYEGLIGRPRRRFYSLTEKGRAEVLSRIKKKEK